MPQAQCTTLLKHFKQVKDWRKLRAGEIARKRCPIQRRDLLTVLPLMLSSMPVVLPLTAIPQKCVLASIARVRKPSTVGPLCPNTSDYFTTENDTRRQLLATLLCRCAFAQVSENLHAGFLALAARV